MRAIYYRPVLALLLMFGSLSFSVQTAAAQSADSAGRFRSVTWRPQQLHTGSPCLFTVVLDNAPTAVTGTWLGRDLAFFKSTRPRTWYALAGVDMETAPGAYDLTLKATMPSGSVVESTRSITIAPSEYKTVAVTVPQKFVEPNAEELKEIAADQKLKDKAFTQRIETPLWSGKFLRPVNAPATPSFGATRIFNEELTNVHRGTDFPAREGTPVVASNAGEVRLARRLFYEGNCVIIDHGQQFLTIYMHLSKIQAEEGRHVRKGERLGLTGSTGRVTGPHLHLGVRWEGAYLDPTKLFALTLPLVPHRPPPVLKNERRPQ
jgi:murein DD-endopeptidase MepM/ murein hydrolase activator NlpD